MNKTKTISIIGIIISLVLIITLLSQNTRPYLNVNQVMNNPSRYVNRDIQVIGNVENYSNNTTNNFFNLSSDTYNIPVDISNIEKIPSDFENNIEVVINGYFNESYVLIATLILTQCS